MARAEGFVTRAMKGRWSLEPVRHRYGVPAFRGTRVIADGKPGTITCGDGHCLRILRDGENFSGKWHPLWRIDYGDDVDYAARYDARVEAFNEALK
jgi:hypothetical protein